jgi:hypothetical protein
MLPVFNTRDELLPYLINQYQLSTGVEVGVRDGGFSQHILERVHSNFYLIGIDCCWRPLPQYLVSNPNYSYIVKYSVDAANLFEDEYFDFIHIDAGHSEKDVYEDMDAWWPKLKSGGFFSGDDYCFCNNPHEGPYGVVNAVENWIINNNISDIYITQLGYATFEQRIELAKLRGLQVENNLRGKEYTKDAWVPNWMIVKK